MVMLSVPVVVLRNLKAIRRVGQVKDGEIKDWVEELVRKLGPLDPRRLQEAFDQSRDTHRAENRFGEVSLDDIVFAYPRVATEALPVPQDDDCSNGCREGEVEMLDREGYTYLVPCSCLAGEHLRRTLRVFQYRSGPNAGQPRRNVDELRRIGWKMRKHAERKGNEPPDPKEIERLVKRVAGTG